jgi:kynurenine 3-monooxygenase
LRIDPRQPLVIGGGLAGSLLAIVLARRGLKPTVLERSPAFMAGTSHGRSINLAMAERGRRALRVVDVLERVEPLLIPMRGRMIHDPSGSQQLLPYGQRPEEQIYSVSRSLLNHALYQTARDDFGVRYEFQTRCTAVDTRSGAVTVLHAGQSVVLEAEVVFALDGAGSVVRRALARAGHITSSEELLGHGYKELTIAARDGEFALEPGALHIWPRGGYMLIALPNLDRTFTATLFLKHQGEPGFAELANAEQFRKFFAASFPDAVPLIPDLSVEFANNPIGELGTVRARPWSLGRRVLLMGDAAHAIVPFHGQGMNAAFEDCVVLDELIEKLGDDWGVVFERFEDRRIHNASAIADMALENYLEMRDTVRDPQFALRKALSFELEQRHPGRFIPRYSMVMFHPEISYSEAQRRGALQSDILDRLLTGVEGLDAVDFQLADRLIRAKLG